MRGRSLGGSLQKKTVVMRDGTIIVGWCCGVCNKNLQDKRSLRKEERLREETSFFLGDHRVKNGKGLALRGLVVKVVRTFWHELPVYHRKAYRAATCASKDFF